MRNFPPSWSLRAKSVLCLAPGLLIAGCSSTIQTSPPPTPRDISTLESVQAREPSNADALMRLGVAYRAAGRLPDARQTLERAVSLQPEDAATILYLGLTYEELEEPALARDFYTRYLEVGRSPELKRRLRARLPLLEQQALRLAVRDVIARERELTSAPPEPGTVAVFPFVYHGGDPALQPLSRALAELLVTDLSQSSRLRVLERMQVQMLLDELRLSEQGLVDPQTAVRSGRLLAAGRVVQGQFEGDEAQLRLQAAVVGVGDAWEGRPLSEADALRRLFELEKRLALGIFSSMGIELTPAERERVMQQPTSSLEALLAFGHCLEAEDSGDFAGAASQCQRAVSLDGGFEMARARAVRAAEAAAARRVSARQLAEMSDVEFFEPFGFALFPLQELLPDARGRGGAVEALGREGFGQRGRIEIILERP